MDGVVLERRRFLRVGGMTGLAIASAALLTACPGQSAPEEGEDGDDSDQGGDEGQGGQPGDGEEGNDESDSEGDGDDAGDDDD